MIEHRSRGVLISTTVGLEPSTIGDPLGAKPAPNGHQRFDAVTSCVFVPKPLIASINGPTLDIQVFRVRPLVHDELVAF